MSKINSLDERWDGLHTGDEIEEFLKEQLSGLHDEDGTISASSAASAEYNTNNATIDFKNSNGVVLFSIDATPFIKDGMVSDVKIENGYFVIVFNTDSGKQPINIRLTDIFDPDNYYNKGETKALATFSSGQKVDETAIAQASDFDNPDDTEKAKIPTVGAILDGLNDGIYDVSKRFPAGGPNSDGKFTLEYILSNADTLILDSRRHGGMSISFVDMFDNKYVQYRCTADEFTTDTTQWAVDDNGVYVANHKFVYVKTDDKSKILYGVKSDGTFFFGAGCPPQVIEYVLAKKEEILAAFNIELATKVDKVEGKGLSSNNYTDEEKEIVNTQEIIDNNKFAEVELDAENKILGGRKIDGTKFENCPYETPSATFLSVNNKDYIEVEVDKEDKILSCRKADGTKVEFGNVEYPNGIPNDIKEYVDEQIYVELPSKPIFQNVQMYNHHDSFNDKSLWWVLTDYLEAKYWTLEQTVVESFIAKFRARAAANVYQVAIISDTHGSGSYTKGSINSDSFNSNIRSIATFNKLMLYCNAGIHGGDISSDYGTSRLRILQYMQDVLKYFIVKGNKPLFITKGNHDENNNEYVEADQLHLDWNNTYYSAKGETEYTDESQWNGDFLYEHKLELVSDKEFKNMAQHYNSPVGAVWGNGAYYFYDIDSAKLRVIVGNSFPINDDYTDGSADEFLWLAQSAFNFSDKNNPQEWQTLMLRHTQATSITALANCINAFIGGTTWTYGETTVDFGDINGGGMTFIAHIHGHEHHYCFSNGASFFDIGETISCTTNLGTATGYGLSVWSIDLVNKKIYEDTISGKTWVYNYASGRLELKRGDSFTIAESGLKREVIAACTEPTINCSGQDVTIGDDTPYGNYVVQAVGSNGNTYDYLISVVE